MSDAPGFPPHDTVMFFGSKIDVTAAFHAEMQRAEREGFPSVAERFRQLFDDSREAIRDGKDIVIILK